MRVSLPINTAGVSPGRLADSAASTRPAAYPRRSTSSGVIGGSPTRPRMPSVPKYFLVIDRTVVEAKPARQHAASSQTVIPAKAGIHVAAVNVKMDPRFRGDDECSGYAFCDETPLGPRFRGDDECGGYAFCDETPLDPRFRGDDECGGYAFC